MIRRALLIGVLLAGLAQSGVRVTVSPDAVTLAPGAPTTFSVVSGPQWRRSPVTWSATCGAVSATGVYVAPPDVGTCMVTAAAGGASDSATVTVTAPEPIPGSVPVPSDYGPQPTIACPVTAVHLAPGADLQLATASHQAGTTFCLEAGVHQLYAPITPKSGNTYLGEYGAILDGSNWTTWTEYHEAAFMAHGQDIDGVTIRNLTIQHMPRWAVKAYYIASDRWTIDHVDIVDNVFGVGLPGGSALTNSRVLRNVGEPGPIHALNGGGYGIFRAEGARLEHNELAYNASETKIVHSANTVVRGNWVHDNEYNGVWFDGDSPGSLIEDNIIEHHPVRGLFLEVAQKITVRRNIIRRSGWNALALFTSREIDAYENTIDGSGRVAVSLFAECSRIGQGELADKWELTNNSIHDNTITVPAGGLAVGIGWEAGCTAAQQDAYRSNTKNNRFDRNAWDVPTVSAAYWGWPSFRLAWPQWQAIGQDVAGRVR